MGPVEKALWLVEARGVDDGELTLADAARVAGVSRHHLARAFAQATGVPLIRYARGRRLTEAARALAGGAAPDILGVALDAGYGSHEAFTRAFRDRFGETPERVRAARRLDHLQLVDPIRMDDHRLPTELDPPRFEHGRAMLLAGLGERHTGATLAGIPALWQRFQDHLGHLAGQRGEVAYGVCCDPDGAGGFDYVCAVEMAEGAELPEGFRRVRVPAGRYAVFTHLGHVSTVHRTCTAIWNGWLPESGLEVADAPDFERYGPEFDPRTGTGGLEIWVPIRD